MEKIDTINITFLSNPSEVANRKSAIGSYVQSLSYNLQKLADNVNVNPGLSQPDTSSSKHTNTITPSTPINQIIKKYIPSSIKRFALQFLKIIKLKENEKTLIQNIQANSFCIDFYCAYSLLVPKIKTSKNCRCAIIYDAPIDEEYNFFYAKRLPFYKKYLKNEKKSLTAADFIIVYSPAVRDFLQKRHPGLNDKQFRIHHNVDFSRLHFSPNNSKKQTSSKDKITIGFVGSFLKWHRVDLLVSAFCTLKDKYPNIELLLIGDGQELPSIKQMVEDAKYKKDIHFTGFLDNNELRLAKEKIDIGIMPSSNWYGAPNKLFEYGAMSIACIAPITPTIEYIFEHKKHLLLFKNNQLEGLTKCLEMLITDGLLRQNLSQNLYNNIQENFSPRNTTHFYQELIGY